MTETEVKCNCFDVFYVCTLIFRLSLKAKEREENNYIRFVYLVFSGYPLSCLSHPSIHPLTHSLTHLPIHPSVHLSIYLSIHPSVGPSVHPSIHPSIHPSFLPSFSIYPSFHSAVFALSIPLSIYSSIHSIIHLSIHAWFSSPFYQVLSRHSDVHTAERKQLSNLAFSCFVQQVRRLPCCQYNISSTPILQQISRHDKSVLWSFGRDPSPEKKLSNACHKLLYCPFSAYLACDQLFIIDWWFLLQTIPLHCVVLEGIHLLTSPGDT